MFSNIEIQFFKQRQTVPIIFFSNQEKNKHRDGACYRKII